VEFLQSNGQPPNHLSGVSSKQWPTVPLRAHGYRVLALKVWNTQNQQATRSFKEGPNIFMFFVWLDINSEVCFFIGVLLFEVKDG
jgi:hypothetical protein